MIFLALNGREMKVNPSAYAISWDDDSLSKFQWDVKQFLRPFWEGKTVCEEFPIVNRMSIDFLNISDSIAIEVQGAQHNAFSKHFHNNSPANYKAQLKRDLKKADWCTKNGIKLVEILPDDMPLSATWFETLWDVTL